MWLEHQGIRPRIVGEFDDSALLKAFGAEGLGFFVSPTLIAEEVERQFGVQRIGDTLDVSERFYAITVSRRIQNPAVLAITGKSAGPSPKSSERRRDVGSARPKER
jgi:LysR family transcriptional activator of nhaA